MHPVLMRQSLGSRIFDAANLLFMLGFSFLMIYPFYNQLVISLNEGVDASLGGLYFWPRVFTLDSYRYIIENTRLLRGAAISVLRVVVGTVTCLFATGLLSWIVTIRNFSGRRFLRLLFIVTLYFGGGLIPFYLLIVRLRLINTFAVYWVPSLLRAYYMLLISSYLQNLPDSLAESARLDGAGELGIFVRIIFPISLPVFAAIAVFTAVGHWNAWFDVLIYNTSGKWDTIQIYLRKILLQVEELQKLSFEQQASIRYRSLTPATIRAATTMIVTLPIVFSYPFLQRYFVKGITLGAIKG